MSPANFPATFMALVVVLHLKSAVSADDAAMGTPISCANCTICQFACHPPPYEPQPLPLPPPPIAEPVPVAPANCPPAIVQCCQFMPPPPPPPPPNSNIYTPLYNESSSSFLKGGLVSVLVTVFGLAAIF